MPPPRTTNITAKDSAGNTTTETWQLNSGGGATPDSTFTYTHDSEGNLLGDGTSSFEWDLRNRLTAIVTGTHRTEFTYDGSDRRVRVVEKESGSVTSDLRYIYQGLSLLEERAANNTTVLRRFYSGGHVDVANGGTRYAYTTDHLGSIREVIELDGTSGNPTTATLAARYDYDLWGKRSVLDGGTAAETLVMHGYTGHVRHAWSGLWLAPYRAYNSGHGRWISRDPIAEDGGINLYGYVGNRVMVAIDPLGLIDVIFYPINDHHPKPWLGIGDTANSDDFENAANKHRGPDAVIVPITNMSDVVFALQKIQSGGVPIEDIYIYDHGSPGKQFVGGGGLTPDKILNDPKLGVGKYMEPDGVLHLEGCYVAQGDDADKALQAAADKGGRTIEASPSAHAYYKPKLGGLIPGYNLHFDKKKFKPIPIYGSGGVLP